MATPLGKHKEGDLSVMLTHLRVMKNDVDEMKIRVQTQALGAHGDPSPSGDSQDRVAYLEAELERTRRMLAEIMQRNRMMELQLRELQQRQMRREDAKSNRSCLQDHF